MALTVLFTALGLVVGGMIVIGIIAFLPSKPLGSLEKKITSADRTKRGSETN